MRSKRSLGAHRVGGPLDFFGCSGHVTHADNQNLKIQNKLKNTNKSETPKSWNHWFAISHILNIHFSITALKGYLIFLRIYIFHFLFIFQGFIFYIQVFIFFSSLKGSMTFVHCRPILCRFTIWEPLWVLISHKLNPLPMHIFALKLIGSRTWSMTVMG